MKFRKKPVVVEAVQYTGYNQAELREFCGAALRTVDMRVMTLEGYRPCPIGYWIVRGVRDEFYPVEPVIFAETYEVVDDTEEVAASRIVSVPCSCYGYDYGRGLEISSGSILSKSKPKP